MKADPRTRRARPREVRHANPLRVSREGAYPLFLRRHDAAVSGKVPARRSPQHRDLVSHFYLLIVVIGVVYGDLGEVDSIGDGVAH